MSDFAFSVPPTWVNAHAGASWGLESGFGDRAESRRAACAARLPMLRAVTPDSGGFSDWAGLKDVAQSFARMWDEVDYGVMLLTSDAQLLYANHVARHELEQQQALRVMGFALTASIDAQQRSLVRAIEEAGKGMRGLREFGKTQPLAVSFLPVDADALDLHDGPQRRVMAIMGKRRVCEALSFCLFARLHQLSPAETRVLQAVCDGHTAEQMAQAHGVAVSTVRTQVQQIRHKTGNASLRDLVRRVASLPPVVAQAKLEQ